MADKKKMSVADILAAARKSDGGGGDAAPEESAAEEAAPEEAAAAEETAAPEPAAPTPKLEPGKKLSVAEMLAMARSTDKPGAKKAAAPAAKPKAAAKPAAAKSAGGAKPAAKAKPAGPTKGAPKDTASILAAARSGKKPGPMSKAEAAKVADKAKAAAKPKPVAPPMPAKPAYAMPKAAKSLTKGAKPAKEPAEEDRRTFMNWGFGLLGACSALWGLLFARFMFPNILTEPPTSFKVGPPDSFTADTVDARFKPQFGVWIVNTVYNGERQIYALQTVCTHLGCTPNWLEAEQKFKCPCHGSGFYIDGINFEGPAPRPLERYAIRIADDGQLGSRQEQAFPGRDGRLDRSRVVRSGVELESNLL